MSYDLVMQKLQQLRSELNQCITAVADLQSDNDILLLENEQQRELLNELGTKSKQHMNNTSR